MNKKRGEYTYNILPTITANTSTTQLRIHTNKQCLEKTWLGEAVTQWLLQMEEVVITQEEDNNILEETILATTITHTPNKTHIHVVHKVVAQICQNILMLSKYINKQ